VDAGRSTSTSPGQLAALVGPSGAGRRRPPTSSAPLRRAEGASRSTESTFARSPSSRSVAHGRSSRRRRTLPHHGRRNLQQGKLDATQEELEAAAKAAFIHERIMELAEATTRWSGSGATSCPAREAAPRHRSGHPQGPRILSSTRRRRASTHSERLVQEALRPLMRWPHHHRHCPPAVHDSLRRRHLCSGAGRIVERGTHAELCPAGWPLRRALRAAVPGGWSSGVRGRPGARHRPQSSREQRPRLSLPLLPARG